MREGDGMREGEGDGMREGREGRWDEGGGGKGGGTREGSLGHTVERYCTYIRRVTSTSPLCCTVRCTHTGSSAVHGVLHLQLGTPHHTTPQHKHTHARGGRIRHPHSHASPF